MNISFSANGEDLYFADRAAVKLTLDKYYTLSFYLKTTEETNGAFYVVSSDTTGFIDTITPAENWTKYTYTFQALVNDLPFFRCSSAMTLVMDDLKISEAIETKLMKDTDIPDELETGIAPDKVFKLVCNNNIDISGLSNQIKIDNIPVTIITNTNNAIDFKASQALDYDRIYSLDIALKDIYNRDIVISREFRTAPVFDVGTLKLYKDYQTADKTELTGQAIVSGDITVELSGATNLTNTAQDINVSIALYKNGEMIAADYQNTNLAPGGRLENVLIANIIVPVMEANDKYELKAFLWKSFRDVTPVVKNIRLHN